MKLVLAVLLAILIVTNVSPAQMSFSGGAQGGLSISSFPTGISDFYGIGYGFGGHADLNIMKYFSARLNLDYDIFPSSKDKLKDLVAQQNPGIPASSIDITGLNISVFGITLNGIGKLPTASALTPYGILGLGLHILSISDGTASAQGQSATIQTGVASQTKFGLNFGAGSEFAVGKVKLFLEVKYVMIFTDDKNTSHVPVTVGVTFGG